MAFYKQQYPIAVFCIIATEFCERFSFCGLRTILSIYLRNELLFSENSSTVIYHIFIMGCYLVPLIGAFCADSFLGRYSTILNFSVIYLIGNLLMCMGAVPLFSNWSKTLSGTGLVLIAMGTGGIKPCVAAFGGDQFHLPVQRNLLQHFFSIFYFTINLGGFVGMVLTPVLRKWIPCFGDDTCYALGFGFPAALMFLALMLFMMGRRWYRLKVPKENIMLQFIRCAMYAVKNKKNLNIEGHWLNNARDKYSFKLIQDMKIVCAVLFLYTPLPIFWSLFDQQGSRWTFQASHMNGNIMGFQIVPDQMQVVNPAIVLLLIPIFDKVIDPICANFKVLQNPLHRMTVGGLFAGLSFFVAGILELFLETTYPKFPEKHRASINVINTLPCEITIHNPFNKLQILKSGQLHKFENLQCDNYTNYILVAEAPLECGDIYFANNGYKLTAVALEKQTDTILIGTNNKDEIMAYITDPLDYQKSLSGEPRLRVAYMKSSSVLHNISVWLNNLAGLQDVYFVPDSPASSHLAASAYMELPQGVYHLIIKSKEACNLYEESFHLAFGGVYSLVINERNTKIEFVKLFTMSPPNTINILWLIPQYFLISLAEVLFGVAGLEFSFTQAPKCMKTVTIAGWYLSVAVGNLIVILVTQANFFESQAYEFFLFVVIMVADMMIFVEMASNYKFVQLEADSSAYVSSHENLPLTDLDESNSCEEYFKSSS